MGIVNHQAGVHVAVRATCVCLLTEVDRKTARTVLYAVVELMKLFPIRILTIETDNGREFTVHECIADSTDDDIGFVVWGLNDRPRKHLAFKT